jgi:hypothetical protein
MTQAEQTVLDHLRFVFDNCGSHNGRAEGFVLQHGKPYSPQHLPVRYRRRPAKQCFMNAARVAELFRLTYIEGFAMSSDGRVLHHAWCADRKGNAIDATWLEAGKAYIGIPFPLKIVAPFASLTHSYGSVIEAMTWREV